MLRFKNGDVFLLDCGEGTAHQMILHAASDVAHDALYRDLKLIYISHMHADHHLGVCQVLQRWQQLSCRAKKLYLAGPPRMWCWLKEYASVQNGLLRDVSFLDHQLMMAGVNAAPPPVVTEALDDLRLKAMRNVFAKHCFHSYSVILDHETAGRLVYSGDTRPNALLVKYGKDARLLIHEATFEDDLVEEAKEKRHSTYSEAMTVAREMKARHVLLTHFSQRYPDLSGPSTMAATTAQSASVSSGADPADHPAALPALRASSPQSASDTKQARMSQHVAPVMALDLMCLRLSDFPKLANGRNAIQFVHDDLTDGEED